MSIISRGVFSCAGRNSASCTSKFDKVRKKRLISVCVHVTRRVQIETQSGGITMTVYFQDTRIQSVVDVCSSWKHFRCRPHGRRLPADSNTQIHRCLARPVQEDDHLDDVFFASVTSFAEERSSRSSQLSESPAQSSGSVALCSGKLEPTGLFLQLTRTFTSFRNLSSPMGAMRSSMTFPSSVKSYQGATHRILLDPCPPSFVQCSRSCSSSSRPSWS